MGKRRRGREKPVGPPGVQAKARATVVTGMPGAESSSPPPASLAETTLWLAPLLVLTLVAFVRVLGADFLRWDDQYYVTANPLLRDGAGLFKIWDPSARATQQYYPLTFSSFWLEYRLWGLDARAYHATNLCLHLINAGLAFALLRGLGVSLPGAALGAGIFALHPVQVASVAWVAERKNVLGALFLLLSLCAFVRCCARDSALAYGASFASFVLALLAKTQVVGLPLALLLYPGAPEASQGASPGHTRRGQRLALGLPFLAVAALAAWLTLGYERKEWTPEFSPVERFLIATNALAFYLRTIAWPAALAPIYPRWEPDAASLSWWIAPFALLVLAGAALVWARRIPVLATWGLLLFVTFLVPVSGLQSFNFLTYSFVADHFLYFSMIGIGIAAGAAWDRMVRFAGKRLSALPANGRPFVFTPLLVLTFLSHLETGHWKDNERFWLRVQARDPQGFLAPYNLGLHYRELGQWDRAVDFFERASSLRPRADYAFRRYAEALRQARGASAALEACERKLAKQPEFAAAHLERAIALEALGRSEEAAASYRMAMRLLPRGSAAAREAEEGWRRTAPAG